MASEITVLTGLRHLADSYGNCGDTHTAKIWRIVHTAPIRLLTQQLTSAFHSLLPLFFRVSTYSILFSSAMSLCRDNEVAIIIVVVELFMK